MSNKDKDENKDKVHNAFFLAVELEIIELLLTGYSDSEIAFELDYPVTSKMIESVRTKAISSLSGIANWD